MLTVKATLHGPRHVGVSCWPTFLTADIPRSLVTSWVTHCLMYFCGGGWSGRHVSLFPGVDVYVVGVE